ncbi:MAG: cob(I)yrinic acid a,c-diamide adenosyltransferase [Acidobacteriota bacterium]
MLAFLAGRPPRVEVVLTGRYAPAGVLHSADLVTGMREETLLLSGCLGAQRNREATERRLYYR